LIKEIFLEHHCDRRVFEERSEHVKLPTLTKEIFLEHQRDRRVFEECSKHVKLPTLTKSSQKDVILARIFLHAQASPASIFIFFPDICLVSQGAFQYFSL